MSVSLCGRPGREPRWIDSRGFTLIETLITVAIIGLIAATALPILQGATAKAERAALAGDANQLYSAFMRYYVDHGRFPSDTGAGAFDTTSLSPLTTEGYFRGTQNLQSRLADHRIYFYWAPDWNSPNGDFILIARPINQPNVYVYAMHYGFANSFQYDGVYLLINGQLVHADGKS